MDKNNANSGQHAGLSVSVYPGLMLAGCALLLAVAVQARFLATVLDHEFALLALGAALFGAGAGLGLGGWLVAEDASRFVPRRWSVSLLASAMALAAGLLLLPSWPLGPVQSFIALLAGFALPFVAWGYGMALVSRHRQGCRVRAAWLAGAIAGVLSAGVVIERLGGLAPAGWIAAALLGAGTLLVGGRQLRLEVAGGALLVLAGAIYHIGIGHELHPDWTASGLSQAPPLHAQLKSGRLSVDPHKHWSRGYRSDLLAYRGQSGLNWAFTNATVPVPVLADQRVPAADWIESRFPLLAVPLRVLPPQRMLTLGSVPGPEAALAQARGAEQVQALAYNAWLADRACPDSADDGISVQSAGDIRARLSQMSRSFEQVFLPITHININNRVASNLADRYLYTREALQAAWERLAPGGMLVVTAADEVLFVRSILSVWNMLEQTGGEGGDGYARRSWGLQLASSAVLQQPYTYLLMVAKGEVPEALPARIREVSADLPVQALFGPGLASGNRQMGGVFEQSRRASVPSSVDTLFGPAFLARGNYAGLYQLSGLDRAGEVMRQVLSRKAGYWLNTEPVTDDRPGFFDLRPGVLPEFKWLLTGLLALLAGTFLFALPSRRGPDAEVGSAAPAVAVYLVYFALLGGAGTMSLTGWLEQGVRLIGPSILHQETLLALTLLGVLLALMFRHRSENLAGIAVLPVAMAALVGAGYMLNSHLHDELLTWPWLARWLAVGTPCLLLGLLAALFVGRALYVLGERLPPALPWAWLSLGGGALAAMVLASWWASAWGWPRLWLILAGGWLLIGIAGLWLWRRDRWNPVHEPSFQPLRE